MYGALVRWAERDGSGQLQQSRNPWSWCCLSHETSQLRLGREEREMSWIMSSLLNFRSCTMKLGCFLGFSTPLWKCPGAHRQNHLKNTDFIDIPEATSGFYPSESNLTISTLKPVSRSLLAIQQLLCKSVKFSSGKCLGIKIWSCSHCVSFLTSLQKIFRDCICKYISINFSECNFFILSGFQQNRIQGIDLI